MLGSLDFPPSAESKKGPERRTGIRRSRAGCFTCKRRRVKCDENFPSCNRCHRSNLPCEGYTRATHNKNAPLSNTPSSANARVLLPKTNNASQLRSLQPTAILPGETEVENRYLKYFQQETSSGFQSAWDWTLWNRLILQGCHNEVFVRYAVVAIGALHRSLRALSPTGQADTGSREPIAKLHREFAYLTYGKALKQMQNAIDKGDGPRHALIACLLIVCFESHTGNRYKALSHAQYGLQILQQLANGKDQLQGKNLRRAADRAAASTLSSAVVEEEIVEAFRYLDIQMVTVNDSRTVDTHERAIEEDAAKVNRMSDQFMNLAEAKSYWNVILRRSFHFIATTWKRTGSHNLVRPFQTDFPGGVLTTVGDTLHTTSYVVDSTVKNGQEHFSTEIDRWLSAFNPVFTDIRQKGKSTLRDYVVGTMLRIQGLAARITVAGTAFTQEILYDQFLPEFKEIVRLAGDVVAVRNSKSDHDFWTGSFQVDIGLVETLFRVLMRCRDPVLRRQAIEILKDWHVECWWDPLLIMGIGRFIMEVEEEGMVHGFIPESARAILTAKSHCPPDRILLVQCVQRTGGPGGGMKWTEKFVSW